MAYIGRLPAPTTDQWDWQVEALCRGMSSAFFFHPWGERGPARDARVEQAKQVCARCPVIQQCRSFALTVQEQYGVWGGLSEDERLLLLHNANLPRVQPAKPIQRVEAEAAGFVRQADRAMTRSLSAAPAVGQPLTRLGRTPRELIDWAKAVVMTRQGMTEQQAFRWLQRTAMDHRTSIRVIAGLLIAKHPDTPTQHIADHRTLVAQNPRPPMNQSPTVQEVLRAVPSHGWVGRRDRALLVLSQLAGLSYLEMAELSTTDVSITGGTATIRTPTTTMTLESAEDAVLCGPCALARWLHLLDMTLSYPNSTVPAAILARGAPLVSDSPHACQTPPHDRQSPAGHPAPRGRPLGHSRSRAGHTTSPTASLGRSDRHHQTLACPPLLRRPTRTTSRTTPRRTLTYYLRRVLPVSNCWRSVGHVPIVVSASCRPLVTATMNRVRLCASIPRVTMKPVPPRIGWGSGVGRWNIPGKGRPPASLKPRRPVFDVRRAEPTDSSHEGTQRRSRPNPEP